MRDEEFRALTEWLAESPAGISAETGEAELLADWRASVSAARWARLSPVRRATPGAASA